MTHGLIRNTVLAFLAHPDDAEILCGGTLIRLADTGWEVHICTATAGDCGSADLAPEAIAEVRRNEGKTAAELIGGHYHCLELRDLQVAYTPQTVRLAIDLFRKVNPGLVLTHPRFDYMLDHEQTHLLARAAAFGYSIPNASELPVPGNAGVPFLYYCDPLEGKDPYSGATNSPTTLIDITAVMPRKAEMLAAHASQREWLRAHHGMDEYIDSMMRHGRMRGEATGTEYVEAFVQHRGHAFPQSDLLAKTLCKDKDR